MDETIELRSIQAKVSAVSSVLARARKFVELDKQIERGNKKYNSLNMELEHLKTGLNKVESVLADPEPYTKPPKVLDNRAEIYPVEIRQGS